MDRLWLIARREILAYTSVASFWVALLIGPLLMGVASVTATVAAPHRPPPQLVRVVATDDGLSATAIKALRSAGLRVAKPDQKAATRVALSGRDDRALVRIEGQPLPGAASDALIAAVGAALGDRVLADNGVSPGLLQQARSVSVEVERGPAPAGARIDPRQIGRYGIAMLLWLTLVGALGMLLQAVVRERSNRALEGLMSAARPVEIVGGKIVGVGVVSLIVLFGWLGSGALGAIATAGAGNALLAAVIRSAFGDPLWLAWVLLIYVGAFGMYGSAIVGLGALARDSAAAQNLSRPIFGVLLLVFFIALSQLMRGDAASGWLAWVPPITPFALLIAPPESLGPLQAVVGVALMAVVTAGGLGLAARLLARQLDGGAGARGRRTLTAPDAAELSPAS